MYVFPRFRLRNSSPQLRALHCMLVTLLAVLPLGNALAQCASAVLSVPFRSAADRKAFDTALCGTLAPISISNPADTLDAGSGGRYDQFGAAIAMHGDLALVGVPGDTSRLGQQAGAALLLRRESNGWVLQQKLTAVDGRNYDAFGTAVAMDDRTLVVSSPYSVTAGAPGAGAVYVFVRGTDNSWLLQARLFGPSGGVGGAVALAGERVLVGAGPAGFATTALIFERQGNVWSAPLVLAQPPGQPGYFGFSVALSADYAVIGQSEGQTATQISGRAHVYARVGNTWTLQATLASDTPGLDSVDHFGSSVAVEGNQILVGAPGSRIVADPSRAGTAYVFQRGSGGWTRQARLSPSQQQPYDQFGASVLLNGGRAFIGAPSTVLQPSQRGNVYVFAGGSWTQQARLGTIVNDASGALLGSALAVSSNRLLAGAPRQRLATELEGALYAFNESPTGWMEQNRIIDRPGSANALFGRVLAVSGDTMVVGAEHGAAQDAADAGVAYVFQHTGMGWRQTAQLSAPVPAPGNAFARSVAIDGDMIVIGQPFAATPAGVYAGNAIVFENANGLWQQRATLTAFDAAARDTFGIAVAINQGRILVGAPRDDSATGIEDAGSVYAFKREGAQWVPQGKLQTPDVITSGRFGQLIALDSGTALIGSDLEPSAADAAYIYTDPGSGWQYEQKLQRSGGSFGLQALALDGDRALLGIYAADVPPGPNFGRVVQFSRTGTTWNQALEIQAPQPDPGDEFGYSVALRGTLAVVGAPYSLRYGSRVYAYATNSPQWNLLATFDPVGEADTERTGDAVGLWNDTLLVGAPRHDGMQSGELDVGRVLSLQLAIFADSFEER